MSDVKCPLCGAGLGDLLRETYLFARTSCPNCRAILEVVDEPSLRLHARRRGGTTWLADWLSPEDGARRSPGPSLIP